MSGEARANAKLAKAGELEELMELADGDEGDAEAYKWLSVAVDFGHEDAEALIEDLLGGGPLHDDDDQLVTGNAHLELGVAYLTGAEGLPKDLTRAALHLEKAQECGYPDSVSGGDEMLRDLRENLGPDALEVFEAVYPK